MKFIATPTGYAIVTETEGPYSHSAPVQTVVLALTAEEFVGLVASADTLGKPGASGVKGA